MFIMFIIYNIVFTSGVNVVNLVSIVHHHHQPVPRHGIDMECDEPRPKHPACQPRMA